jgi:hypothetical protein
MADNYSILRAIDRKLGALNEREDAELKRLTEKYSDKRLELMAERGKVIAEIQAAVDEDGDDVESDLERARR